MIELKCARENLGLVFARKLVGRLERKRKPRLAEFAAGIFLELNTQGRHYVERCVESRHLAEYLHHAPVIFHGMKARPRQNVLPSLRIAILWLVHVPHHDQVYAIHQGRPFQCKSAPVLHSPFFTCASWNATSSAKFSVMPSLDSWFSRLFFSFRNSFA